MLEMSTPFGSPRFGIFALPLFLVGEHILLLSRSVPLLREVCANPMENFSKEIMVEEVIKVVMVSTLQQCMD